MKNRLFKKTDKPGARKPSCDGRLKRKTYCSIYINVLTPERLENTMLIGIFAAVNYGENGGV